MATSDTTNLDTSEIRNWRSIVTLIVFVITSKCYVWVTCDDLALFCILVPILGESTEALVPALASGIAQSLRRDMSSVKIRLELTIA